MDDTRLTNINQIREFLKSSQGVELSLEDYAIEEKYEFVDHTVDRLHYSKLSRREKKVAIKYLKK
ncbi:integrase, partial [Patescibacteria group bacterium]|nr:integrase [Patescibacteria group bacterium]